MAAASGAAEEEVTTIHHRRTLHAHHQDPNHHRALHAVLDPLTAGLDSGLEPALVLQEAIWLANTWLIEQIDRNKSANVICMVLVLRTTARVGLLGLVEVVVAAQQQDPQPPQAPAGTSQLVLVGLGADEFNVVSSAMSYLSISIFSLGHFADPGPGFCVLLLEIFVLDEDAYD